MSRSWQRRSVSLTACAMPRGTPRLTATWRWIARQIDDVRRSVARLVVGPRSGALDPVQALRPADLTGVLRHYNMRTARAGTGVAVQIFTEYARVCVSFGATRVPA